MIGLTGCKTAIKQDLSPSLAPSKLDFPRLPKKYRLLDDRGDPVFPLILSFEKQFQSVTGVCLIERDVLYKDIKRIEKTEVKLSKEWWEFYK